MRKVLTRAINQNSGRDLVVLYEAWSPGAALWIRVYQTARSDFSLTTRQWDFQTRELCEKMGAAMAALWYLDDSVEALEALVSAARPVPPEPRRVW